MVVTSAQMPLIMMFRSCPRIFLIAQTVQDDAHVRLLLTTKAEMLFGYRSCRSIYYKILNEFLFKMDSIKSSFYSRFFYKAYIVEYLNT